MVLKHENSDNVVYLSFVRKDPVLYIKMLSTPRFKRG